MPRSCTVCEHARREAIDCALVGETSNLSVSSLFGVSESADAARTEALEAELGRILERRSGEKRGKRPAVTQQGILR